MSIEEGWVNAAEVASHLQVAKESIYRWVESKGFPAHRVGRLLRFKLSEVDEWVRKSGAEAQNTLNKRKNLEQCLAKTAKKRLGRNG